MGGSIGDLIGDVLTFGALGQRKAAKEAAAAQEKAAMEARKIAASQKPMEESATLLLNTGVEDNTLGSLGLMIDPTKKKPAPSLSTSGTIGLSSTGTTTLGFGS